METSFILKRTSRPFRKCIVSRFNKQCTRNHIWVVLPTGLLFKVIDILQHPDFADGSGGYIPHDVCVLTAATPIEGTGVTLDTTESESDCWITGWGVDTGKCSEFDFIMKILI